jgi:hypothetical protein
VNFLGTSEQRRAGAHRAHLRLLRGGLRHDRDETPGGERNGEEEPVVVAREAREAQAKRARTERSRILIAGADPERRAAVRADLTEALPADTEFGEAGAAWEVLEQAPSSGVVMLAGDLDEVTAESLMHVLGHRHPSLPVVALGLFADGGAADGRHSGRAAYAAG